MTAAFPRVYKPGETPGTNFMATKKTDKTEKQVKVAAVRKCWHDGRVQKGEVLSVSESDAKKMVDSGDFAYKK